MFRDNEVTNHYLANLTDESELMEDTKATVKMAGVRQSTEVSPKNLLLHRGLRQRPTRLMPSSANAATIFFPTKDGKSINLQIDAIGNLFKALYPDVMRFCMTPVHRLA